MIVSLNVCMTFIGFLCAEEFEIDYSPKYIDVSEGKLLVICKN